MKTCTRANAFVSRTGKAGQQALALQKIRRLASSSLPVYPFVLTLFDLTREAIPMGDTPQAISTDPTVGSSWVFSNLDQSKWVPILSKLTEGDDPTALPAFRPRDQLVRTGQILLTHMEFTHPDYKRSNLYMSFFDR
jgi:hypothetical protein